MAPKDLWLKLLRDTETSIGLDFHQLLRTILVVPSSTAALERFDRLIYLVKVLMIGPLDVTILRYRIEYSTLNLRDVVGSLLLGLMTCYGFQSIAQMIWICFLLLNWLCLGKVSKLAVHLTSVDTKYLLMKLIKFKVKTH